MYSYLLSIAIPVLVSIETPPPVADASAWSAPPQALEPDERSRDGSSCDQDGRSLCYDPVNGRIVVKKTREFMPALPGLRPEHVSLRRDRITFKYSFR